MSDHELSLDCGPCEHWDSAPRDPQEWRRFQTCMFSWKLRYAWDFDWKAANCHPLIQSGSGIFTIYQARGWASRELER